LKTAGLSRVNVSLDSLDPDKFAFITGSDKLDEVLKGIEVSNEVGLVPVKINVVVLKGINDNEILDFARKTVTDGWHVRFIEYMPFTGSETERNGFMSVGEVKSKIIDTLGELEPHHPGVGNGPASYFKLPEANGTLGFIGAISECFCAQCNRFRLTADGMLRPCLLDDDEIDIKEPLRRGADIIELAKIIQSAAVLKRKQHNISNGQIPTRMMRHIGG
jgi:cyclic pyranopterin phosphate synthase